ncbi:hypothetical protein [Stenotrophomonas sp.]|uniref:hypothetical protein n=1 Tax=Stenotrophomonas sp. TaxID=69392 RepID=UPI0028ABBF60|nr:hypothetical protein [Stenotrophomonas sp.]
MRRRFSRALLAWTTSLLIVVLGVVVADRSLPDARLAVTTYRQFSDLEFLELQEDMRLLVQQENASGPLEFKMASSTTYFEIHQNGEPVILVDNSAGRLLMIVFGQ